MRLAKIKWDKSDDGKEELLVVKPTLLCRLLGKEIVIFKRSIYS